MIRATFEKEKISGHKTLIFKSFEDKNLYLRFKKEHPELKEVTSEIDNETFPTKMTVSRGVGDNFSKRVDSGFKDVLKSIKKANVGSTIDV